jgi:predicted deacylase
MPRTASTSSGFRRITPVDVRYVLRSSMASITAMLSTLAVTTVIGWSTEHRPIELLHRAGPGPRVLVVGCIHGNECAGLAVVTALERTHPREDLWLLPNLNPDGYALRERGNARGVDLNRTFPNGREAETRTAVALIRRLHPDVTIWFHQHEDRVRGWGRSRAAARRYARLAGMRYAAVAWPSGAATRWQNTALHERSFVVELPAGALDPWQIAAQVRAVLGVAVG